MKFLKELGKGGLMKLTGKDIEISDMVKMKVAEKDIEIAVLAKIKYDKQEWLN